MRLGFVILFAGQAGKKVCQNQEFFILYSPGDALSDDEAGRGYFVTPLQGYVICLLQLDRALPYLSVLRPYRGCFCYAIMLIVFNSVLNGALPYLSVLRPCRDCFCYAIMLIVFNSVLNGALPYLSILRPCRCYFCYAVMLIVF